MQEIGGKRSRKQIEWRQRLARFAACGQGVKLFCQAESVSEATFHRWRKQLTEDGDGTPEVGFIDVGLLAAPPASPPARDDQVGAAVEIRLDLGHGLVLHIVRR
ncbi:MAG: IS66 family insertion sequence element accessory protein TnpB [Pseudomonadota bacterium]